MTSAARGTGRQVVVRVPGSPRDGNAVAASGQWLTASFTLDEARARRLERGGRLRTLGVADDEDLLIVAFGAACVSAGVEIPAALRCRAVSEIPIGSGQGASAAAVVAGVIGARALLDLPFDDAVIELIAAAVDGTPGQIQAAIKGHTCLTYTVCSDAPSSVA